MDQTQDLADRGETVDVVFAEELAALDRQMANVRIVTVVAEVPACQSWAASVAPSVTAPVEMEAAQDSPSFTIDGRIVPVPAGVTVLEAALAG